MAARIDMNCDMGESFGMYKMGLDEEIIHHVSSANVACGFHAGDPTWMRTTVRLAEENGVAVGAHPSYPDLVGFGRRNMNATADEVKCDVAYQLGALQAFTAGKRLQHVKPHGAMYNQAVDDADLARAICEAALEFDPGIILVALAGSKWVEIASEMGMKVAPEIFADRALNADGTLVSRSKPGAVLHDVGEVVERSVQMVTEGVATATTGERVDVEAASICIHGDTPGAVDMAAQVRPGPGVERGGDRAHGRVGVDRSCMTSRFFGRLGTRRCWWSWGTRSTRTRTRGSTALHGR